MSDTRRAMILARDEILQLRRRNEVLQAKVDTMDLFASMLFATPPRAGGSMGEDAAWLLQKEIDALNAADDANRQAATE